MSNIPDYYMARLNYAQSAFQVFNRVGFRGALDAAQACSAWSMEYALHLPEGKRFPTRMIPNFGIISSLYALTIMSCFLYWQQAQTTDEPQMPEGDGFKIAADAYKLYLATIDK